MEIDALSTGEAAEGLASKKGRIGAVWAKSLPRGLAEKRRGGGGRKIPEPGDGSHRCRRLSRVEPNPAAAMRRKAGWSGEPHHRGPGAESGRSHFVLKAAGKREAEAGLRGVCAESPSDGTRRVGQAIPAGLEGGARSTGRR